MLPLLIDEGLPAVVAAAFRAVEVDALAIGDVGAPAKASPDETNVPWCAQQNRLLVTNDRGKKNRVILGLRKARVTPPLIDAQHRAALARA